MGAIKTFTRTMGHDGCHVDDFPTNGPTSSAMRQFSFAPQRATIRTDVNNMNWRKKFVRQYVAPIAPGARDKNDPQPSTFGLRTVYLPPYDHVTISHSNYNHWIFLFFSVCF
jgi:hypothetical protein